MITANDVAGWADLDLDTEGEAALQHVVAAVLAHAAAHYDVPETIDPEANADLRLGLLMQAARLYKRRQTADGITVSVDGFTARVSRFDADIDQMLDRYRMWAVG